jgi:hypothetical protein
MYTCLSPLFPYFLVQHATALPPCGFRTAGPAKTCLRLIHSQYGISEAPQLWYEHLLKALLDLGLMQCQHDQCLFYKMNLLIVLYVDDAGIAAPETKYIDEFISSLEKKDSL